MSSWSPLPASWSICTDPPPENPDVYPPGGDLEVTEVAEPDMLSYSVSWKDATPQGRSLGRLVRIEIGKAHRLHSKEAAGSDGHKYTAELTVSETVDGYHIEADVRRSNSGDPGDLSGSWGADAKSGQG